MAVELKNEIQAGLGVVLSVAGFLKGATVSDLAGQIVARLEATSGPGNSGTPAAEAAAPIRRVARSAEDLLRQINDLPEDQLRAMTLRER